MKNRFTQIFVIIIFALIFSSCVVPLDKVFSCYGSASSEPTKDEIVDEATFDDMRERGKYIVNIPPKFIFQSDGKFKMENMPDWWKDGFGQSHGGFETNSGTWKLSKYGCC